MNLAKFLKGCTTIGELMDMPNKYIHTLYKQYVTTVMDQAKSEEAAKEEVAEEMMDALSP